MKKLLTELFRDNPETPEGKYLAKRRDGTVPEWPSFVLGAADPLAESALKAYAAAADVILYSNPTKASELGLSKEFANRIYRLAEEFREWRQAHTQGDPGMGQHRKDDPETVAEMRKGKSS